MKDPTWRALQRSCRRCHDACPSLIYSGSEGDARPLLHEGGNLKTDVLFVLAAANHDDTFNPDKGHVTICEGTDPTGTFLNALVRDVLQRSPEEVLFMNSVLCLPAKKASGYPIPAALRDQCLPHLKATIDAIDPPVVAPMGGVALKALSRIAKHDIKNITEEAGVPVSWYGRTLFPLVSASALGQANYSAEKQRADWRALSHLLEDL